MAPSRSPPAIQYALGGIRRGRAVILDLVFASRDCQRGVAQEWEYFTLKARRHRGPCSVRLTISAAPLVPSANLTVYKPSHTLTDMSMPVPAIYQFALLHRESLEFPIVMRAR